LEFINGLPENYQSSDIAKRGFCIDCGSPIVFSYKSLDAVSVGILNDAESCQPNRVHIVIENKIPWTVIHDKLIKYRTEEDPDFITANYSETTVIK